MASSLIRFAEAAAEGSGDIHPYVAGAIALALLLVLLLATYAFRNSHTRDK